MTYFISAREQHTKLFSFRKRKDLYTVNRFQACIGVSTQNCLLSQLFLAIWLKEVVCFGFFFTCFGLTAGMKYIIGKDLIETSDKGRIVYPQESVFGQERSLFDQLNLWLTC